MLERLGRLLITTALLSAAVSHTASAQSNSSRVPVRIGVLEDMTGPLSSIGGPGNVVAVRMAVEDFGGEVLGRTIEVLSADDQNKPDVGLAVTRRWFDLDNVTMVTGLGNSAVALAVQNLARERKRINIVAGAASTELTGKFCSPTGFQWNWDTHAMAATVVNGMMDNAEAKSWYFITVDYAFGHAMERDASALVRQRGGVVAGSARHPLGTVDFGSFLLQAQASKAQVVALASASSDIVSAMKSAAEFGVADAGQKIVAFAIQQQDVAGLGLEAAKGLITTSVFFAGMNAETRAFSDRFAARFKGQLPGANQAGVYSATLHYLRAMQAAGTDAGEAVAAAMHRMPVTDFVNTGARIRTDGRLLRSLFLVQVKSTAEASFPGDFFKVLTKVGPEIAFDKKNDDCSIPSAN